MIRTKMTIKRFLKIKIQKPTMSQKKITQQNKIIIIMIKRIKIKMLIIIKNNQIKRIIKNNNNCKQIIIHYKTKEITLMNWKIKGVINKKKKNLFNSKMNLIKHQILKFS